MPRTALRQGLIFSGFFCNSSTIMAIQRSFSASCWSAWHFAYCSARTRTLAPTHATDVRRRFVFGLGVAATLRFGAMATSEHTRERDANERQRGSGLKWQRIACHPVPVLARMLQTLGKRPHRHIFEEPSIMCHRLGGFHVGLKSVQSVKLGALASRPPWPEADDQPCVCSLLAEGLCCKFPWPQRSNKTPRNHGRPRITHASTTASGRRHDWVRGSTIAVKLRKHAGDREGLSRCAFRRRWARGAAHKKRESTPRDNPRFVADRPATIHRGCNLRASL